MIIRKATTEDIPAIVQLLKASLGDVSSEKSVAYWNWKHVNNPFGPSPVLVAEEGGVLIGVRALMRWDWQEGTQVYRALRAVDTATHPEHQGKGIFKKLTLQLVEAATHEGYDFIFNSPNTQSTPGYLKMGWEVWGKMPLWVRPLLSFQSYQPAVFERYHQVLLQADLSSMPVPVTTSGGMHTALSPGFFQWRYQQCPVKKYGLYRVQDVWIFFTVKQRKQGMELRICHVVTAGVLDSQLLFRTARRLAVSCGCRFITLTGLEPVSVLSRILHGYVDIRRFSVTLTIRQLANKPLYQQLKSSPNWMLQNGDIELF